MSGSGGGSAGGGASGTQDSPCDNLKFEARISSPKPAVVATLVVGDVLDIAVTNMKGQIVVEVLKNSNGVGGLTGPDATRLRNCMDQGHKYKATVRNLNGGQVLVKVEHV